MLTELQLIRHRRLSQPYVTIGALTTRHRPDAGIKDSQENIRDTGYFNLELSCLCFLTDRQCV